MNNAECDIHPGQKSTQKMFNMPQQNKTVIFKPDMV